MSKFNRLLVRQFCVYKWNSVVMKWAFHFFTHEKVRFFQEDWSFQFSLSIFFFCSNYSLLNEISSLFQRVKVIECIVHNCTKFFPSFLKSVLWLVMWSRLKEDIIIWDVFICLRIWMSTRITYCELKMKKKNMYVIYPMLFQIPSISNMVNEVLSGLFVVCVCVCCLMADHKVVELFSLQENRNL